MHLGVFLGFLSRNSSMLLHVRFIADKEYNNVIFSVLSQLCVPLLYVVKGRCFGDIIDE